MEKLQDGKHSSLKLNEIYEIEERNLKDLGSVLLTVVGLKKIFGNKVPPECAKPLIEQSFNRWQKRQQEIENLYKKFVEAS